MPRIKHYAKQTIVFDIVRSLYGSSRILKKQKNKKNAN